MIFNYITENGSISLITCKTLLFQIIYQMKKYDFKKKIKLIKKSNREAQQNKK